MERKFIADCPQRNWTWTKSPFYLFHGLPMFDLPSNSFKKMFPLIISSDAIDGDVYKAFTGWSLLKITHATRLTSTLLRFGPQALWSLFPRQHRYCVPMQIWEVDRVHLIFSRLVSLLSGPIGKSERLNEDRPQTLQISESYHQEG